MVQIKRIDTYSDDRFSQEALYQHGCFLIDDLPFEIKIISSKEAVVYGKEKSLYPELIDEFRFYQTRRKAPRFSNGDIRRFLNFIDKII